MSKSKKPKPPPAAPSGVQPSAIYYGDQLLGETKMGQKGAETYFYPTQDEKQRREFSSGRINQLLQELANPDPQLAELYKGAQDAYTNEAMTQFDKQYAPLQRRTREDFLARYGTLKSDPYIDRVMDMERDVRTPAINSIVNQGIMLRQGLADQTQARKLKELQAMGYDLNLGQQQFLQGLQGSGNLSQMATGAAQNAYGQNLARYNAMVNERNSRGSFWGDLFGTAVDSGRAAASAGGM